MYVVYFFLFFFFKLRNVTHLTLKTFSKEVVRGYADLYIHTLLPVFRNQPATINIHILVTYFKV